jgi:hypothetical protein
VRSQVESFYRNRQRRSGRYRQSPTTQTVDRARKGFTNQQDTIPSNIIPKPSIFALNAYQLEE